MTAGSCRLLLKMQGFVRCHHCSCCEQIVGRVLWHVVVQVLSIDYVAGSLQALPTSLHVEHVLVCLVGLVEVRARGFNRMWSWSSLPFCLLSPPAQLHRPAPPAQSLFKAEKYPNPRHYERMWRNAEYLMSQMLRAKWCLVRRHGRR